MAYSVSVAGKTFIKQFETGAAPDGSLLPRGEPALASYLDPAGVWTIGWGHTSGVRAGDTITRAQAEAFLARDLATIVEPGLSALAAAHATNGLTLNQNQIDAVASLMFNAGSLALAAPNAWGALKSGNFQHYLVEASEVRNITVNGQKVVARGLEDRRADEAELFVKADYIRTFDSVGGNPGAAGNPYALGNYTGTKSNPGGIPKDWQLNQNRADGNDDGQDIVLLIDLSSSMASSVLELKAAADQIALSVFGADSATATNRMSIITYDGTGPIDTTLSLTDQKDNAARKSAVVNAINSLETADTDQNALNTALLNALSTNPGNWGKGVNRIMVLTDKDAGDPSLKSQVISNARENPAGGVIEITPVIVGGDVKGRPELLALASGTGGQIFQTHDTSLLTNPLLQALRFEGNATSEDDQLQLLPGQGLINGLRGTDIVSVDKKQSEVQLSLDPSGGTVLSDGSGNEVMLDSIEFVLTTTGLISATAPHPAEFNEAFYLSLYSDVAAAVAARTISSGFVHFLEHGASEGRLGLLPFDEEFYLSENPDVLIAVSSGDFQTGKDHFVQFGIQEGRDPVSLFDTTFYLAENPDVADAVSAMAMTAFEHFLLFGIQEGRRPSKLFSEDEYFRLNPDVDEAGMDAFAHYNQYGAAEGRLIAHSDFLIA